MAAVGRPRPTTAQLIAGDKPAQLYSLGRWRDLGRLLHLPKRQLEVARLISAEFTTAQIARRLRLSPDTVATHLKVLYQRLGARSRVGLVVRIVLAERSLGNRNCPGNRLIDERHDRIGGGGVPRP